MGPFTSHSEITRLGQDTRDRDKERKRERERERDWKWRQRKSDKVKYGKSVGERERE